MRHLLLFLFLAAALLGAPVPEGEAASWSGVDETVIEKFADAAGRPAREPFINTDQGDLLLFVFLLAGIGGGFVAGYSFRTLFPPRPGKGAGHQETPGRVAAAPGPGRQAEQGQDGA